MKNIYHIKFIESPQSLLIQQKWVHGGLIFVHVLFSVITLYLTYFIYKRKEENIYMFLLSIVFLLIFLINTYIGLARILNSTHIHITKFDIRIHHSPLPWFNNHFNMSDIDQIKIISKKQPIGKHNTNYITVYSIAAIKKNKEEPIILTFTPIQRYSQEDVQYVYQKINTFLEKNK